MQRIVMHIDVNNAFLSWSALYLLEKGYKKDIREISAIIGGSKKNRTGIVLAKSTPAKEKGIVTAETLYQAIRKDKNLQIYPPNFEYYIKKSKEMFKLIRKYSKEIQIGSIDECYLEYTNIKHIYGDEIKFAYHLKSVIKKQLGFTVNIGIGNNKLCAKMASNFTKPNKVHTLYMDEVKEKLYPLPIRKLYGVGISTESKLKLMKINTIKDLATFDENLLRKYLKNQAEYLIKIANGIDDSLVKSTKRDPESISNEITLSRDVRTKKDISKILKKLSEKMEIRLQDNNSYTKTICLILKNNEFKRYTHQTTIKNPTNKSSKILSTTIKILNKNYDKEPIRLIGIRVNPIKNNPIYQLSFWDKDYKYEYK
jgi:DNA polymerase-4